MNLKLLLTLVALIAIFLFFKYCLNPTQAIVEIKSTIQAPTGVAFIEVKDGTRQNVTGRIKVTFIDSAGMVMSANGVPLTTIDITSVMSIGLSPNAKLSVDKPYLFYIKVESEGYATNIKPVVITQNTAYYIPIYMVKLDALPSGNGLAATVGTTSALIDNNQTIVAGTGAQSFRLTIPEGTRFSVAGKEINSESKLSYYLLRGNALDSSANLAFPGGFEVVKAMNETGKEIVNPIAPAYFTTAGWFTMELKDETGQKIDGFSKPVEVEMPINNRVKNPITQAVVKAGDRIPLWSMNEQTGVWIKNGETTVVDAGGGQLKTKYSINHLSTWNLDFLQNGCNAGTQITVSYNNAPGINDFNGSYFSEYIRESDGLVVGTNPNLSITSGGSPLILLRAAANSRLYVHEGNDVASLLKGRTTVLTCGGIGTLGLVGSNSYPCVDLEFTVQTDGVPTDRFLCSSAVWYKQGTCASGYLYNAGITVDGKVKIFSEAINQECLELKFSTTEAVPREIRLTLNIPYSNPSTVFTPATGSVYIGAGAPTNFTYQYLVSSTGATPPNCGKKVQIVLVNAVVGIPTCAGM